MPEWLTIVISVVGSISTVLGVLGVNSYLSERAKHKANARLQEQQEREEELQRMRQLNYENALRNIIREEVAPLKEDITEIKANLSLNTQGTVTILRDDMKKALDAYKEKGFADGSDRANWSELYKTYAELGGNHFKEYVNAWKQELDNLPLKKRTKIKKEILNENKK